MRPVKAHNTYGTPTAERLAQVCAVLGPVGKKLPLAWLADLAGVPRSTLKNAASRDSLSYDVAWQIAGLFEGDRAATVEWLRNGTSRAPTRPKRDTDGVSEAQLGSGAAGHQDDRAERLAGIAARAFILAVRGPDGLDGHLTAAAQRQLDLRPLGEAMLAFASELMRKEFLHTPALMAVAQRLIEGVDLPDIATIAAGVHGVVAASPRTRTAEGRREE